MAKTKEPLEPLEPFGPIYPDLGAGVAKHRRMASRGGFAALSLADRRAYGEAVGAAIRSKQRAELARVVAGHKPNCASGTFHNNGADIHRAVQSQLRASLTACPSQERRAREPHVWQSMYAAAMKDKRAERAPLAEIGAAVHAPKPPKAAKRAAKARRIIVKPIPAPVAPAVAEMPGAQSRALVIVPALQGRATEGHHTMIKRLSLGLAVAVLISGAAVATHTVNRELAPRLGDYRKSVNVEDFRAITPEAMKRTAEEKAITPQQQRMKDCGAQWKAHKAKTGEEGRDAWNAFRSKCLSKDTKAA